MIGLRTIIASGVTLLFLSQTLFAGEIKAFTSDTEFGKFDARLNGDLLTVTLRVFYDFRRGSPTLAPGYGAGEYQWTAESQRLFKKELELQIESVWSGKFFLAPNNGTRKVNVIVDVVESRKVEGATWNIIAGHYPVDASDISVSVCDFGQRHYPSDSRCVLNNKDSQWGSLYIGSHQVAPEAVSVPVFDPIWFIFKAGSSNFADNPPESFLTNSGVLRTVKDSLESRDWSIRITGFAGAYEEPFGPDVGGEFPSIGIARERLATVQQYLSSKGIDRTKVRSVAKGEFHEIDGNDSAVELSIHPYMIPTAAHEAGHMFGLPDEAITLSGSDSFTIGDKYRALVMWYIDEEVHQVDEDNIMSRGSKVLARHYVPFLEAVEALSGEQGWTTVTP